MIKVLSTLAFVICALFATAQAPQKFNYQAVARNSQGAALPNQSVGIRASILDASASGVIQYSETHNVTTNQLGLFALAIGSGTIESGNFGNVTWADSDKYLQIEMDATGGSNYSLIGTSQLLSVPYALVAGNGSQWSNNANGINYSNGNVGIGMDAPIAKLHLPENSIIKITPATDSTKSGLEMGNSYFYDNHDDNGSFSGNSTVVNKLVIGTNTTTSKPIGFFTQNTERLTITSNGLVGIGTNTVASKLQVHNGDVFLDNSTNGVIMKSPNGQCWRMTVTNAGQAQFTSITCPQ